MTDSPASLVAVASAAHQVGDTELRRSAVQLLREKFGIRITFDRKRKAGSHNTESSEGRTS